LKRRKNACHKIVLKTLKAAVTSREKQLEKQPERLDELAHDTLASGAAATALFFSSKILGKAIDQGVMSGEEEDSKHHELLTESAR
jgi:hypothetical protein